MTISNKREFIKEEKRIIYIWDLSPMFFYLYRSCLVQYGRDRTRGCEEGTYLRGLFPFLWDLKPPISYSIWLLRNHLPRPWTMDMTMSHNWDTLQIEEIIILSGAVFVCCWESEKCKCQEQNVVPSTHSPNSNPFSAAPSTTTASPLPPPPRFPIILQVLFLPLHLYLNKNPPSHRCLTPIPTPPLSDSSPQTQSPPSIPNLASVVSPRRFWTNPRLRWPLRSHATVRPSWCKSRPSSRGISSFCWVLPEFSSVAFSGSFSLVLPTPSSRSPKAWLSMASLPFHLLSLLLL